jgi:twitching motility protein PilT
VALVAVVTQQLLRAADGSARLAVFEILLATAAAAALIRDGKTAELAALMRAGQSAGMQTAEMALERLLALGRVTPEAALEAAHDREAICRIVGPIRPDLALA